MLVICNRFAAHGLDQLVKIQRILKGLAGNAKRTVGLTADVAGKLDTSE